MLTVPVVMLIAAVAVLVGVIAVALGRGGELAYFPADYPPLMMGELSATDIVLFRPPRGLWGYDAQVTDEALDLIAEAITERDIEITSLRQRLADLQEATPSRRLARRDPTPPHGLTLPQPFSPQPPREELPQPAREEPPEAAWENPPEAAWEKPPEAAWQEPAPPWEAATLPEDATDEERYRLRPFTERSGDQRDMPGEWEEEAR
jgi:hypothetical protein